MSLTAQNFGENGRIQEINRVAEYARKVDPVMKSMLAEVFEKTPNDPVQFMIDFLLDYQKKHPPSVSHELPYLGIPGGRQVARTRRSGVSAEPLRLDFSSIPNTVVPKSTEDKQRIRQAIKDNILFTSLDEHQMGIVLDAMELREYKAGDTIIQQGADGDHFFVLDSGECDAFVSPAPNQPAKWVRSHRHGECFGEIALMYNVPRTASIKAKTACQLFAMDRLTFQKVLLGTTAAKRNKFESFLSKVHLLASLDKYERSRIADELKEQTFYDGDFIIEQGDSRDTNFYILLAGEAKAMKNFSDDDDQMEVMRYKVGDYFGELALLGSKDGEPVPRAATVVALGDCKVVSLDRGAFTRLMGPCEDILKRNRKNYESIERQLQKLRSEMSKDELQPPPVFYQKRRRTGVSAEPTNLQNSLQQAEVKLPMYPKTAQQLQKIRTAIANNFLFTSLDEDQLALILGAMFEVRYPSGAVVIQQGADGDNFYVIESGTLDCYVQSGKEEKLVYSYNPGESFGELALMYNTPRAATVKVKTDVVLWAMDRVTFRTAIMDLASKKRLLYESFLGSIPLLASLDKYERSKISDCVVSQTWKDGECIIRQGDAGDRFYMVEQGKARATKILPGKTSPVEVYQYSQGDYFGELALVNAAPRAANVFAVGTCKTISLERATFHRLLGPLEDILKRNMSHYQEMEKKLGIHLDQGDANPNR